MKENEKKNRPNNWIIFSITGFVQEEVLEF